MSDLIDTTEMYLRTIYELQEEGIPPLRARIAERLGQSGPTVSQTVARMERDGLLVVSADRHLELTARGRAAATRVMRKHRLAECMLVEMLQMPWEEVHAEACRWEHVMSDAVERQILLRLGHPSVSPYGNPIPGLEELNPDAVVDETEPVNLRSLPDGLDEQVRRVTIRRLTETIQAEPEMMTTLKRVGATPGSTVRAHLAAEGVMVGSAGEYAEIPLDIAGHILVDDHG